MAFELDMGIATHGGTDALGVPAHDFSTNRNASGPCPQAVIALQAVHVAQYPDPAYTALRAQLAAWHGVEDVQRILIAGSASEWIHRITAFAARSGARHVTFPAHHYGDYAQAAQVWGLQPVPRTAQAHGQGLHWACSPSSPLGVAEDVWHLWHNAAPAQAWRVLDCAYAPLRLGGQATAALQLDTVWQMWTPNKALGMTGVRAAYAIAPVGTPAQTLQALRAMAPSWVVGAHGVAMLQAWCDPDVQHWLAASLVSLQQWKAQLVALCAQMGWQVDAGHEANYLVARWPTAWQSAAMQRALAQLRDQGIKLRDCSSFGLPGCVRLGVLPPASQHALYQAWLSLCKEVS